MIIVGNLKMNFSLEEMLIYERKLRGSNLIICPSYPYLGICSQEDYILCAQNVSEYDNGPYTGEVSASQLKSLNINYVLIGHSERRHTFMETQEVIDKKIIKSLDNDLMVIYCIGETKEEKDERKTLEILERQLKIFSKLNKEQMSKIIIGYEPVWAISDGINPAPTPTNEEIDEVNKFIKNYIKKAYNVDINVLYGGSVNLTNVYELLKVNTHDGFLIGGASKKIDDLIKISEICKQ